MARGLNKVQLIGRLGAEPEMKYTPQGSAVTSIRLATGGKYKKSDGSEGDDTEWHRIVFWDKLAEIVNQYAEKGSQIYVEGKLKTRKWQDDSGADRYTTEIVANEMQLLGSKGNNGESSEPQPTRSAQAPRNQPKTLVADEDLPF